MTKDAIKRIAEAIYAVEGNQKQEPGKSLRPMTLDDEPDDEQAIYYDYARAAIVAIEAEQMADIERDIDNGARRAGHQFEL